MRQSPRLAARMPSLERGEVLRAVRRRLASPSVMFLNNFLETHC